MSKEIAISEGYEHNGKTCFDVTIGEKTFDKVARISKCKKCKNMYCCGAVRTFDCPKNANFVRWIWNLATSLIPVGVLCAIFKFGFFKGSAALIVSMVGFDMICCTIEKYVVIIRNNYFYFKLKRKEVRQLARAERKKRIEEARKQKEQVKEDAKDPNRVKIREAEKTVEQIAQSLQRINFYECHQKIQFCVAKCREIIEYLKQDTSSYSKVENLFGVYLPEFYKTLTYYAELENSESISSSQSNKLMDTVNYFYSFLSRQEIETILEKKPTEIKFKEAADTLKREIESRGGKL